MSDDATYTSFLSRANQPVSSSSKSTSKAHPPTSSGSTSTIPAPLQNISKTYTSDTDSAFEPVMLKYIGPEGLSVSDFERCLVENGEMKKGEIREIGIGEFDPRGEYRDVVSRVEEVAEEGRGVKVFRVERGATRVEYYILTLTEREGERLLLGVVARAVES